MLDADHPREACGVFGVWAPGSRSPTSSSTGCTPSSTGPGVRRRCRRRSRRARLQGDGPGQPGVRRADAGHPPGAPGHRPHPLLDHRRLPLGERPAGVQDQRRRGGIALAHNGNLTNTAVLAESLGLGAPDSAGGEPRPSSDTDVMAELLAREADLSLEEAIVRTMPRLEGAFSLVIMDERTLYGVRDRHGVRPLCIGKLRGLGDRVGDGGLDIVGATLVREVEPGEVVAIDAQGCGPASPARAAAVRVRARLPGPGRLHPGRPERPPGPPRPRRRPGRGGAGRGRPGHPRAPTPPGAPPPATPRPAASPSARA